MREGRPSFTIQAALEHPHPPERLPTTVRFEPRPHFIALGLGYFFEPLAKLFQAPDPIASRSQLAIRNPLDLDIEVAAPGLVRLGVGSEMREMRCADLVEDPIPTLRHTLVQGRSWRARASPSVP
jgi:hypothetical protein